MAAVLIVEDERKLRDLVRSYLKRAGFTVLSTGSGAERTADSHMKNLRRKIEDDPANPVIVQTVLGGGYRPGLARDD